MIGVLKTIRLVLRWGIIAFFTSSILAVIAYKWLPVPITPLMIIRSVQQVSRGESIKMHHKWVSIDNMSASLPIAVMTSEDQLFLDHNGFDFKQIEKALSERSENKRKRGASTITQQTAKNVFLWHSPDWVRKGLEAYFTVLIEIFWSKKRIMEVYLNSIEMGRGVYGAEAVAQHHFDTTANKLTKSQCALIAASLPNPIRFNSAEPSGHMLKRRMNILRQMNNMPQFPK